MLTTVFLVLLASFAPHAALYVAWSRLRRRSDLCDDDPEDAVPFAVLALAFALEWFALLAAAGLSLLAPVTPRKRGDGALRLVLLHGLAQNRGTVALLARRLARLGIGVHSFEYRSLPPDVAAAAEALRRLLAEMQRERSGPIVLLGFGLGGLVARYCVRRHSVPGVRRVLTLGTAHQGTLLAPPYPAPFGALRPGSAFLTQLAAADRAPEQFDSTALQSEFDATILPPENGYYPSAFNVTVRDTGHFSLLFSRRILALLVENLELS